MSLLGTGAVHSLLSLPFVVLVTLIDSFSWGGEDETSGLGYPDLGQVLPQWPSAQTCKRRSFLCFFTCDGWAMISSFAPNLQ
jgi:hypothetical protein